MQDCTYHYLIGGILTGNEIARQIRMGNIKIDPFDEKRLNPNSYNLRIAPEMKVYDTNTLDMKKNNKIKTIQIPEFGFTLRAHKLYLAHTVETTWTDKFIPRIEGRSSIGRLGMITHASAGLGDIGFNGTWTLHIIPTIDVKIYPYEEIAQLIFYTAVGDTSIMYDGHYQNQTDATASRMYQSMKGE